METFFINRLKPFFNAIVEQMDLYVPRENNGHYVFNSYEPDTDSDPEFNDIRVCSPAKEFLFPMREIAAVFPEPASPQQIKPFAVFGLKDCDLRAISILDRVFTEEEFLDPFYIRRRENMFIISADCNEPPKSCFCNLFDGQVYPKQGFDLNVSKINDGFIIECGSEKGRKFMASNESLFTDVPAEAVSERDRNRTDAQARLEQNNADFKPDCPIKEIVENSSESAIFDTEAKACVECQACTRVCPTCHCFYLYDTKQSDYFGKMKVWDSCVRLDFTTVAGGENPRKILGDRTRHRMMHKFVYFLDRYGIQMCVGCGRCLDGCAGEIDTRDILKKLSEELKAKK